MIRYGFVLISIAGYLCVPSLAQTTTRASVDSSGVQGNNSNKSPKISSDGRYLAFASLATNLVPGDTNRTWDVFVHDTVSGTTTRVSVDSSGAEGDGNSGYGFESEYGLSISSDGRYVAFDSTATNLVPGDTNGTSDVFVHDRVSGTTTRVSVDSSGAQGNGASGEPSVTSWQRGLRPPCQVRMPMT